MERENRNQNGGRERSRDIDPTVKKVKSAIIQTDCSKQNRSFVLGYDVSHKQRMAVLREIRKTHAGLDGRIQFETIFVEQDGKRLRHVKISLQKRR